MNMSALWKQESEVRSDLPEEKEKSFTFHTSHVIQFMLTLVVSVIVHTRGRRRRGTAVTPLSTFDTGEEYRLSIYSGSSAAFELCLIDSRTLVFPDRDRGQYLPHQHHPHTQTHNSLLADSSVSPSSSLRTKYPVSHLRTVCGISGGKKVLSTR